MQTKFWIVLDTFEKWNTHGLQQYGQFGNHYVNSFEINAFLDHFISYLSSVHDISASISNMVLWDFLERIVESSWQQSSWKFTGP